MFGSVVKLPGALDFDLLIKEAEALVNSTGTVVYRGTAQGTVTGADVASYRIYQSIIDDATRFQRAWRAVGKGLKASWRGVALSVATEVAFDLLRQFWEEKGIGEGLDIMSEAAMEPTPREAGKEPKTKFRCAWSRDNRTKLVTFKEFEERRYNAAVKWLEGDELEGSVIASGIGILKVYKALAESMLAAMVAAYLATELGRGPRGVKTKRVRAPSRVRRAGRPKKGTPEESRRKGQWRKKHLEPM